MQKLADFDKQKFESTMGDEEWLRSKGNMAAYDEKRDAPPAKSPAQESMVCK